MPDYPMPPRTLEGPQDFIKKPETPKLPEAETPLSPPPVPPPEEQKKKKDG